MLHQLLVTGWNFAILNPEFRWIDKAGEVTTKTRRILIEVTDEIKEDMRILDEAEHEFMGYVNSKVRPPLILLCGIRANRNEYENFSRNVDIVAYTENHWWGLKQERLTDLKTFPRYAGVDEIPYELQALFKRKVHNRMQVGRSSGGTWLYFDYEDVKFYLRGEDKLTEI